MAGAVGGRALAALAGALLPALRALSWALLVPAGLLLGLAGGPEGLRWWRAETDDRWDWTEFGLGASYAQRRRWFFRKLAAMIGSLLPRKVLHFGLKLLKNVDPLLTMTQGIDLAEFYQALDSMAAVPRIRDGLKECGMRRLTDWTWKPATIATKRTPFTHPMLRPIFFFPGVTTKPFYDPKDFPWVDGLKAQLPVIREELLRAAKGGGGFNQYLIPETRAEASFDQWRTLMFVTPMGARVEENVERCPRTWEILNDIPGFVPCNMTMFSSIDPGGRIKSHVGLSNLVLRVHLGVAVPEPSKSVIRAGPDVGTWAEGEVLIFSDAYDHQVWNFGEATRAVLFFDIWNPQLSEADLAIIKPAWDRINAVYGPVANEYERKAKVAIAEQKNKEWFIEAPAPASAKSHAR